MLISKVPDDDGGKGEGQSHVDDNTHEYQTANELFEMMAKNKNFNASDGDTLTPRDLVLLYKNIDLGTKLMSGAKDISCVKPNQHVETVVYHDDPESDESDVSDMYSNEDLQNVFLVNNERLDLLNIPSSVGNTLCHKLGDLQIQTTDDIEYNRQFLFQDPFIKEQLKNFNLFSNSKEVEASVLPASLLDYVCCKRLEDNYNFYMDNIIRYVKNTIEQLKRISNGDYLTDKAKEKWKEVEQAEDSSRANTKLLATSTSIPMHVECKFGHQTSTWDDIVHSEVDVRSLSKILEKKIIVEVPKCISGSYKLLSKCCDDNLIISCQKENPVEKAKDESRLDVVFKLKRSETGHVVSNISSIMILQTAPIPQVLPEATPAKSAIPLAVLYKEVNEEDNYHQENKSNQSVKITELNVSCENDEIKDTDDLFEDNVLQDICDVGKDYDDLEDEDNVDITECLSDDNCRRVSFKTPPHFENSPESSCNLLNNIDEIEVYSPKEASYELCPADLRMTMQKLSIQSTLPEENVEDLSQSLTMKKKSSTKVRIKSPYENQSHAMEEKKRKKLLEIREKREKKKIALAESCKINKSKYGNRAPMPQASTSVTKLSITNKSFYNSIYGQTGDVDSKQAKNRNRRGDTQKELPDVALDKLGNDEETPKSQDQNNKKFINRSYYLDDAVTEMMYLNMKQKEEDKDIGSASTSGISGEFRTNLSILSQLIAHNDTEISGDDNDEKVSPDERTDDISIAPSDNEINQENETNESSQSTLNIMQPNDPNDLPKPQNDKNDLKKIQPSIECRKSIDKIYKLMNKMGKRPDPDSKSQNKYSANVSNRTDLTGDKGSISIQGSDSGTSLKHHLTSSNPSSFSFDRHNNPENSGTFVNSENPMNVTPKVIISSKSPIPVSKTDEKTKRDKKTRVISPKVQETNPLKAISQLLHEFENVQRNRLKSGKEQKPAKKNDTNITVANDGRTSSRQGSYKRRSRIEQHNETMERNTRVSTPKDRKPNQKGNGVDPLRIPYQQVPTEDRYIDKPTKKKIIDILDEAKEARGEAVRGPSKFNSRLNSLAQPKRTYVQAHSEEYQNRYGRNLITDRLQKLAAAPTQAVTERAAAPTNVRNRTKRHGNDAVSAVSLKLPFQSSLPIERPTRTRHSTSNSPEAKDRISAGIGMSYKQNNVAETPETFKKMVAVESYVKNHYGRASSSTATEAQKSRAPLFPNDIDMGSISSTPSPKESTEVGTKLHHIIDYMLKNPSCGLEALDECHESNSRSSKDNPNDLFLNMFQYEEGISVDSDFATGITDEDIVLRIKNSDEQSLSGTDAEKNKHALCSTISVGSFPKPLRMKNLRLTPKSSIQPLLLLQAGDTGSIVLNASLSQNSEMDKLLHLKGMPVLSKTNLNWSFTNIPMQITTVGYAFPEYKCVRSGTHSLTQLLEKVSKTSSQKSLVCINPVDVKSTVHDKAVNCIDKVNKDSQCYRGRHLHPLLEQDPVGDDPKNCTIPTELRSCLAPDTVDDNDVPKTTNDSNNYQLKDEVKENKTIDKNEATNAGDKNDCCMSIHSGVDNTASFDLLVGLLNEIKKITKCQTHITSNDADECKELEVILNKTSKIENSSQSVAYNNLSLTNLDRLRCLESNPSVYSLYLSDNEAIGRRNKIKINRDINPWCEIKYNISHSKPTFVDKETSVNIPRKEYVHRLTDVPSICFPITINHSTDVANPLIEELCQASSQSLFSYHSTYSNVLSKSMLELPQVIDIQDVKVAVTCCKDNQEIVKTDMTKLSKRKSRNYRREMTIKKTANGTYIKCCLSNNSDYDPVMKMKRDILVTIYSMLVFTVFAALSFPEVLFNI
ncbi:unnamed protein product [Arctia plantaginis]|uniref:Uncharacterized protein n=1 Tax=Arctia plantaginis TaxID=874455 RepID=A0A8S1BNT4_ARCPL|nr:unnamed protein product [Arctia plantaginis]CAB3260511.1 unnamed protein product [Arctia plantaginis]